MRGAIIEVVLQGEMTAENEMLRFGVRSESFKDFDSKGIKARWTLWSLRLHPEHPLPTDLRICGTIVQRACRTKFTRYRQCSRSNRGGSQPPAPSSPSTLAADLGLLRSDPSKDVQTRVVFRAKRTVSPGEGKP